MLPVQKRNLRTPVIAMLVCSIIAFAIALVSFPVTLGAALFGAVVCLPLGIAVALRVTARRALSPLMDGDEG
jgi:ABC-type proline/glycine betaine transport system permease subunit